MSEKATKDLLTAENELAEIVGSCVVFLNSNGVKMEAVKEMIYQVVDHSIAQTEEALKK